MCLLEKIESWNENEIVCTAISHLSPNNPLSMKGKLHIIHGVEYAAQAVAVHGRLLIASGTSSKGLLASTRNLRFNAHRFDNIKTPIRIHARSLASTIHGVAYSFTVSAGEKVLISGECTIIIPSISAER